MSFQKPKTAPFEKDFPGKDNYTKWEGDRRLFKPRKVSNQNGRNNKSYQYVVEMVQPFNNNTSQRSPTTSASEHRARNNNTYLKMPFGK